MLAYGIDGFHIDMLDQGFGPPYGCWCPKCREKFQAQYGRPMPKGVTWDADWERMLEFRYRNSVDFERALRSHIRRRAPRVTVDFNYHGYPPFSWRSVNGPSSTPATPISSPRSRESGVSHAERGPHGAVPGCCHPGDALSGRHVAAHPYLPRHDRAAGQRSSLGSHDPAGPRDPGDDCRQDRLRRRAGHRSCSSAWAKSSARPGPKRRALRPSAGG